MNLALALSKIPRHLLASDGPGTGVRHEIGGPKGVPLEIIRRAAVSYIIGQVTTPVTWVAVAKWVSRQAGLDITAKGVSTRVARVLEGRVLGQNEERNALCAAYYIVCRAHGIRQPWKHIAERLWQTKGISKQPSRLNMDTLAWMQRQILKHEVTK